MANFGKFKAGGDDREGFVGRQTALFTEADVNGNGTVERTEFPRLISTIMETFGIEPTDANLDHFFNKIDSDHDGKITKDEYFAWLDNQLVELSTAVQAELDKRGAQ